MKYFEFVYFEIKGIRGSMGIMRRKEGIGC
jgi:hypothetical protein